MYEGPIAAEMVDRVRNHCRPGTLSAADLAGYKPIKREALCGTYRVWIVCGMPPPSSGGIAILQVLGLIQPFDIQRDAPNDLRAVHLHRRGEPARLCRPRSLRRRPGFRGRAGGGPAVVCATRGAAQACMSPDRSMGKVGPGVPPGYVERGTSHITHRRPLGQCRHLHHHHRGAVRRAHDGARLPAEQRAHRFLAAPRAGWQAGGQPGAARQRPRSSMSPTFVLDREGKLVAALGSAGGARIIGDTLQALIGLLDWDLSALGCGRSAAGRST